MTIRIFPFVACMCRLGCLLSNPNASTDSGYTKSTEDIIARDQILGEHGATLESEELLTINFFSQLTIIDYESPTVDKLAHEFTNFLHEKFHQADTDNQ